MAELTHPCVVDLREVLSNRDHIFMVMQYCPNGELYDIVRRRGAFSEADARRHFQRLVQGVAFCHSKRIYHRDLKPENLFLDENGDLCIGDFGLAALRGEADDTNLKTICGTPHFAAPEVMGGSRRLVGNKNFKTVNQRTRSQGYEGAAADVWSCGCILYFFLTGNFPFDGNNFVQLQIMVQKTEPYFAKGANAMISDKAEKLIRAMMVKDPEGRITLNRVMKDPWFRVNYVPVKALKQSSSRHFDDDESETEMDIFAVDEELVVSTEDDGSTIESRSESTTRPIRQLNAFELINMTAFDVANIFDSDENTISNATRFLSSKSVNDVQRAVCAAARKLGYTAIRQTSSRIMFEHPKHVLVVTMRAYQVVPGICLFDCSRDAGSREMFHQWFDDVHADPNVLAMISKANV